MGTLIKIGFKFGFKFSDCNILSHPSLPIPSLPIPVCFVLFTILRSSSSGQKRTEREREREREKGPGTRGTPNVLKRLHSQPDSQKEQQAAIKALKEMTGKPTQKPTTSVQPDGDAVKPAIPVQPVADALDEDTICRKAGTIVDELTQNRDFKV